MNEDCKKKCQIFTPAENVANMLDWVGYSKNLYGKKIIEPTFGQGNILIQIVERYIEDCKRKGMDILTIKKGLENDIYGIEYDKKYFEICKQKLNELAKSYHIENVHWQLFCTDSLIKKFSFSFDYVVGNPPYISYRMLDIKTRDFVKKNYEVCKNGKFDYCYAFIEKGVSYLKEGGKLIFLIPGSIFKNVFSKKLRDFLLPDLNEIHDYGAKKLFNKGQDNREKNILTSSAIILLVKNSNTKSIRYFDEEKNIQKIILKKNLKDKWIFTSSNHSGKKRFGDYFKVSNSIATLYNKAYIIHEENSLFFEEDGEQTIIKDTASPRGLELKIKEKIIFPYFYDNGKLRRYKIEEFKQKFPKVVKHLLEYDEQLRKRNNDKGALWFEYGRSQALRDMNQPKLLTSIVVTKKVKVYELTKNNIPYSGIYIIPISTMTLKEAKKILESKEFFEYIKGVGISASGDSIRITSKDIDNYYF